MSRYNATAATATAGTTTETTGNHVLSFVDTPAGLAAISATKLADCQSQPDSRQLRIDKVGVKGLLYPIEVRDKAAEPASFQAAAHRLAWCHRGASGEHGAALMRAVEKLVWPMGQGFVWAAGE